MQLCISTGYIVRAASRTHTRIHQTFRASAFNLNAMLVGAVCCRLFFPHSIARLLSTGPLLDPRFPAPHCPEYWESIPFSTLNICPAGLCYYSVWLKAKSYLLHKMQFVHIPLYLSTYHDTSLPHYMCRDFLNHLIVAWGPSIPYSVS